MRILMDKCNLVITCTLWDGKEVSLLLLAKPLLCKKKKIIWIYK